MSDFNTAQLECMMAKGLTLADIIEVANLGRRRNSNAERQARFRAKRQRNNANEGVTNNVTDNALPPPIDNNHTPPVSSNDETKRVRSNQKPAIAKPLDVSEQVWIDWIAHRKLKKSPVSETALAAIRREADAAGWGMDAALAESVQRGWQGFKADWVTEKPQSGGEVLSFADQMLARKARSP